MAEADRVVAMVGLAFWTVRGSQGEVAPMLFGSPEYTAWKPYEPVALNLTALELGRKPLVMVTVETGVPREVQAPLVKTE